MHIPHHLSLVINTQFPNMSQGQPRRPQAAGKEEEAAAHEEPIKYGDVFQVSGELASKPIAPQDAATMQAAENLVLGKTLKGGPAAIMQSVAMKNESAGLVGHHEVTDIARDQGVIIAEAHYAGSRIVTEAVGAQVLGQYITPDPIEMTSPLSALDRDAITIGEALEATAISAGYKPVDHSDAAAIQAAEVRATGCNGITPGGVAAMAQSAASANERILAEEEKVTLSDVLTDAQKKLPADKPVTAQDAEGVIGAEIRNKPDLCTDPGGVAASMAAAARLNQNKWME